METNARKHDVDDFDTNDMFMAIENGDIEVVRYFVDHGIDMDITGNDDYTLVQWAAKHNHTEIIKLLIDHGADTDSNRRDRSALKEAVNNNNVEIVKLLLEIGEENGTLNLYEGDIQVLNLAVRQNCIENVKLLLEYGADVDDESFDDTKLRTALHSAVSVENVDMVCLLLEHGASTIKKDCWRIKTPLELSIIKDSTIITNILLTHVIIEKSLDFDIDCNILRILNQEMRNRGSSWEKELDNMRNEKICDGYNVSVYDILRANQDEMFKYVRIENIREVALKTTDYSDKLYCHMLQNHVKRGLEQLSLFNEGSLLLQSILNNVRILPDLCVSIIFSYFNGKDIKYLVESHQALS